MSWQVGALVVGVAGSVAAPPRVRAWAAASAVACAALVLGIVPWSTFTDALDALGVAARVPARRGAARRPARRGGVLRVTRGVVRRDASPAPRALGIRGRGHGAVQPRRRGRAAHTACTSTSRVVTATTRSRSAFVPALLASLASSVLPVSNLTNLVLADQLGLGVGDFLRHAAPAAVAATVVGWFAYRRVVRRSRARPAPVDPIDPHALRIGLPVVAWLLLGFTFGDVVGLPAWSVAAVALGALVAVTRRFPWRHVPITAAALALALGTLALGAADVVDFEHVLTVGGRPGRRSRSASRCSPRTR